MTIAISLKVNDGLVLSADSASTLVFKDQHGQTSIGHVYNHANKVFNLKKSLPIGAITWGAGSMGKASLSTLIKDLRDRFDGDDPDWKIDDDNYQVEDVAKKFRKFMFEEMYEKAFAKWPEKPSVGFIVAGYSTGQGMAEEYEIAVEGGKCPAPRPLRPKDGCGAAWRGQPEAISRLLLGYGSQLPEVLHTKLKVPKKDLSAAMAVIQQGLQMQVVFDPMPIQDAIDLAEFLVDLTERFSRFTAGAETVGGPIEVAAITKHEGFKWVKRKHYYSREFNPEEPGSHDQ